MISRLAPLAFAAALLALVPSAASAKDSTIMLASNGTQIGRLDESGRLQWQPARPGMVVRAGDVIKAGRDGAAISHGENQVTDIAGGATLIAGLGERIGFDGQSAQFSGGVLGGLGGSGFAALGLVTAAIAIPLALAVNAENNPENASPR
jgi:hypothetical protein